MGEHRLKVLHVSTFDVGGGAAKAAVRLHLGLLDQNIESHLLTVESSSNQPSVSSPLGKLQFVVARTTRHIAWRLASLQKTPNNQVVHSLGMFPSGLGRWINNSELDLVNLHWVGSEALSIREIAQINKPIVWTMHDMWPFMGAEHYDDLDYPNRWEEEYTTANRPPAYRGPDLDRWVWNRKKKLWGEKRMHLVSPSSWLAQCAQKSALMGHQPVSVIANPLDCDSYRPLEQSAARELLGLPENKKLILFGAFGAESDSRKGFDLLVSALKRFEESGRNNHEVELMIFGNHEEQEIEGVAARCHYLGELSDDISLRCVYSAADVFVAPSRQDNLPNTIVEAGACGLPVVAFNIGGIPDIVKAGKTGQLAEPFNTNELANLIHQLLDAPIPREVVRATTISSFSLEATIPQYVSLYEDVLSDKQGSLG